MAMAARSQWIAKMYPGKTGRDHLGLGSVSSDQVLLSSAPGTNVLMIHPCYHSFYTFPLDEFWRQGVPRTRAIVLRTASRAVSSERTELRDSPGAAYYIRHDHRLHRARLGRLRPTLLAGHDRHVA